MLLALTTVRLERSAVTEQEEQRNQLREGCLTPPNVTYDGTYLKIYEQFFYLLCLLIMKTMPSFYTLS